MSFPDDFVFPRTEVDGGREADRQRRPAGARLGNSPGDRGCVGRRRRFAAQPCSVRR